MKHILILLLTSFTLHSFGGTYECGLPPLPPIGCKQAICVCDSSGNYCSWQFVCY